jgi:hypothetical protein
MMNLPEFLGTAIVAAGVWLATTVTADCVRPDPVAMRLEHLRYENGQFVQSHVITGVDVISASCTAQITRGSRPLCQGGGVAPYESGSLPKIMSPSEWTGDTCPAILPGDSAAASWEWLGSDNTRYRISGVVVVAPEP